MYIGAAWCVMYFIAIFHVAMNILVDANKTLYNSSFFILYTETEELVEAK